MKVLVCEDDEIMLKVIEAALLGEKVQTTYVSDGKQAMEKLKDNNFDVIITDIHMPFHNGDEIIRLVRGEQRKKIPIIIVSSDNEEEVVTLALQQGATDFITKPIDPIKLNKKLKKYLPK